MAPHFRFSLVRFPSVHWLNLLFCIQECLVLQLGLMGHLEDLDFADDLALISETIKHLQDETNRLVK